MTRMRRLRKAEWMRDMLQEHHVSAKDLIYPLFLQEGKSIETPIDSLPGVSRWTPDLAASKAKEAQDLGIPAILLFGVYGDEKKDHEGSIAQDPNNIVCQGIQAIKEAAPDIGVIADLCFCEYTDHGHCGPLTDGGDVDNDAAVTLLASQAVNLAKAGADIIAPSDMMDGRVAAIREALDEAGFQDVAIMSYAVKFASSFYGPFREAAGCALGSYPHAKKDRKTYQMNAANANIGLREADQDVIEGADMLIVKPGLPYLDMIWRVKQETQMPVFAYHVSGEFAMLKAAAQNGWLDYEACVIETMLSFKRAGCDGIITYAALDIVKMLRKP